MRNLLLLSIVLHAGSLVAQAERIDSLMRVLVDRTEFSGTVLVADKGEVIYHQAFGLANREWNVPNTLDSRYKLASLTKQFTALLILQLAEEGKLSLDDPLVKHLPEYKAPGVEKILLRHLLSHTSGFPHYHQLLSFDSTVARLPHTLEQFVGLFSDKPLLFVPGTGHQYSNVGYSALALVAQRVGGRPYSELLSTKVFTPAGMADSFTENDPRVMPHVADGYVNVYTHYDRESFRDPSAVIGAGDIISTTMDLFRYDRALRTGKLLSRSAQEEWVRPVMEGFGLGWKVMRYPVPDRDSVTVAYHDGGNQGFTTVMYRFLENDRCIVVLSNTSFADVYGVAGRIGRILHGRPFLPVLKHLVMDLARMMEADGIEAATNFFREHRSDPEYNVDGASLNNLGYEFLREDRIDDAVRVFELNVETFPEVADLYDSLGEGYMKQGRKELAIANYRKTLELDPNHSNAAVMLNKLQTP